MTGRVVIIGAGIGGLGAALGLARRGVPVTIVERDGPPTVDNSEDAFLSWDRKMVAQFRQPHGFSSRSRNLLKQWAPDVLDTLATDGVEEFNPVHALMPPEEHRPDDELFTGVMARRPAFELALRKAVDAEPAVEIISPVIAEGLVFDAAATGTPRVTGVRLRDGREVMGAVVLDCGGRRSPVAEWLTEAGVTLPTVSQPCDLIYYTRYFREVEGAPMPRVAMLGLRGDLGYMMYGGFPSDHGTFSLMFGVPPWEDSLKVLRHNWAWDGAARTCEGLIPWVDAAQATPISDVLVMVDQRNVRRQFVVDGEPLMLGLLPVGDALCATNPAYGWGASLALTYAFAAAEAITAHPDDLTKIALDYDLAVGAEADACYHESAAMDRVRGYQWRGEEVPEHDQEDYYRQDLVTLGVVAGARKDPLLLRAFLRRINLIEPPDALFADPEVVAHATAVRERIAGRPPRRFGPTRDEMLELLAHAQRDSGRTL